MTDEPFDTCPVCGGNVKRLIGSGAGIIFRGSGFYCTDYRDSPSGGGNGKTGGNADKSGDASATGAKAAAGSGETKAASKSETKKEAGAS